MSITPSFNFFCKDVKIFNDSLNSITRNKNVHKKNISNFEKKKFELEN